MKATYDIHTKANLAKIAFFSITVKLFNELIGSNSEGFIIDSKMVDCTMNIDTSFVQCWNCEYRMVNKTTLLNSACIVLLHTNVNKQLAVE